jgi:hypothetical protein
MVMSPAGLGPENDCAGKASGNCKRLARPLVREGAPTSTNPQLSGSNNNLVWGLRWGLTPRYIGRLTVGITLISTISDSEKYLPKLYRIFFPGICLSLLVCRDLQIYSGQAISGIMYINFLARRN